MDVLLPSTGNDSNPCGAFHYILRGFQNAFEYLGHNVIRWDISDKHPPCSDPDIYIGDSSWFQSLPNRTRANTKVCYHVNPHGHNISSVGGGPRISERPDYINRVSQENPDFVFGYYLGGDVIYWKGWRNDLGIPTHGIPPAGDHVLFYEDYSDERACELAYVGGYWNYKATNIEKYLEPARKSFGMSIYGWGGWDSRSLGNITTEQSRKVLSSAKIGPCIHEPHTSVYGIDVPERIFKVPLCGTMAISDPSASLHRHYFPKEIMPIAESPEEYVELIGFYLQDNDARLYMTAKQREHVLRHHTYINRVATMMLGFGLTDEYIRIHEEVIPNLLRSSLGINP